MDEEDVSREATAAAATETTTTETDSAAAVTEPAMAEATESVAAEAEPAPAAAAETLAATRRGGKAQKKKGSKPNPNEDEKLAALREVVRAAEEAMGGGERDHPFKRWKVRVVCVSRRWANGVAYCGATRRLLMRVPSRKNAKPFVVLNHFPPIPPSPAEGGACHFIIGVEY